MKGVFKCAKEDDERRFGSVTRSSLGRPPWIPNKYSGRLKLLSLGMPPSIPFSIKNHQFVLRLTIFWSLHALCAMLGASWSLLFYFSWALFAFHNKLEPNFRCVGEKHAPLYPRTQHRIFMLIFDVCVLYLLRSYCHVLLLAFMLIFLKSLCLVSCWNSLDF